MASVALSVALLEFGQFVNGIFNLFQWPKPTEKKGLLTASSYYSGRNASEL